MVIKGRKTGLWPCAKLMAQALLPATSSSQPKAFQAECSPGMTMLSIILTLTLENPCFQVIKQFREVGQELSHIHRGGSITGNKATAQSPGSVTVCELGPTKIGVFFKDSFIFILCVCLIWMYVCIHCVQGWWLQRPEENTASPGFDIKGSLKLHGGAVNRTQVL